MHAMGPSESLIVDRSDATVLLPRWSGILMFRPTRVLTLLQMKLGDVNIFTCHASIGSLIRFSGRAFVQPLFNHRLRLKKYHITSRLKSKDDDAPHYHYALTLSISTDCLSSTVPSISSLIATIFSFHAKVVCKYS